MSFKDIFPFLTFILGIFFTGHIEGIKEKARIKTLKKNVLLELEDELCILERSIKVTSESIDTRRMKPNNFQHISLGKRFNPILLEKNINDVYSHFNRDTRVALKNCLLLMAQIKEKYDYVYDNWKTENIKCRIKEESMLFSMLSLYYLLNKLKNEKDRFTLPDIPNDEIVERAAEALQVLRPLKKK
ncbi:hypothetical protein F1543_01750 [Enterobacter cloacae]|uniref:hypothetical protein n=1 Tax=Enterobacter cloacae TaxID=550 RepID=UPI001232B2DB|nr:hypothetical protein [Enterobacter cloacae]KAA5947438.1 hypothetical protein F1543_01750 [Enterobacter cloacae]